MRFIIYKIFCLLCVVVELLALIHAWHVLPKWFSESNLIMIIIIILCVFVWTDKPETKS